MTVSKELGCPTLTGCLAATATFNVQDRPCVPLNPWSPHFEKSLSPIRKFKNASPQAQVITHTQAFLYWSITYNTKCSQKKNPEGEKIQISTNFNIFFRHGDALSRRTTKCTQTPKRLASPAGLLRGAWSTECWEWQVGPSHNRATTTRDVVSRPPQQAFQSALLSRTWLHGSTRHIRTRNFQRPAGKC